MDLQIISTQELVKELSKRSGVKETIAEPYEKYEIKGEGPVIILEVID